MHQPIFAALPIIDEADPPAVERLYHGQVAAIRRNRYVFDLSPRREILDGRWDGGKTRHPRHGCRESKNYPKG